MKARAAIILYCLCFAGGAFNHARDFLARGPRPYRGAPIGVEAFWSGLVVVDLLVVALLLTGRRRGGLSLALAVMIADVAINSWVVHHRGLPGLPIFLILQTAFLGFIAGSIAFLWPLRTPVVARSHA